MSEVTEERIAGIEQRMSGIETSQARMIVLLENLTEKVIDRTNQSDLWRGRVEKTVYGDGNGNPGHHIKLDRLLQAQERQKWTIRTIGAVAIGLALKAAVAALSGG